MVNQTILRLPAVIAYTGLSRSAIYEKQRNGEFPNSIKLGPRAVGWVSDDIESWIQERIDDSRSGDHS